MKSKNLFAITIIFFMQVTCINLIASEENASLLLALPQEIIQTIAQDSLTTMISLKRTCKLFADNNIEFGCNELIKNEDYSVITKALLYFADTNQVEQFKKFIQNNYDLRIADLEILGWGKNPSLEDITDAYSGMLGIGPRLFNFDTLDSKTLKRIVRINPSIQDENGNTALHVACIQNDTKKIIRLFNDKRTNPNIINPNDNTTPLYLACEANNITLVKLLLKHPQIIKDVKALDIALTMNHAEIINLLQPRHSRMHYALDKPQKTIKPSSKTTLNQIYCMFFNEKVEPPKGQPLYNNTSYDDRRSEKLSMFLLPIIAFLYIKNSMGYTALDQACWSGETEVANMLREQGCRHSWKYYAPHAIRISLLALVVGCCYYIVSHATAVNQLKSASII